jgi:hypothetical protein
MSSSLCPLEGVSRILCTSHASRKGFVAAICAVSVIAGQNAFAASVIGVVTESSQASIGGSPALRGQTVLSGDSLFVGDGAAIILLAPATRIVARRDTQVAFQRDRDGATVALMARGDLSFSHDGDNPEILVRTRNITIRPASRLRTQGVVTMRDGALTIAASSGSVRVEGAGQAMDIPEGRAVQFLPQGDTNGGTPVPTPAPTAAATPAWVKPVLCGLAGGAVGSIPVIVKERESVSTDVGAYWAAIPGGIGAGVLLCEVVPPKKNLPLDCSLKITSDYKYRARDIRDVQSAWPANYTLIWTSQNATALNLTYTKRSEKKNLFDNPPVHEAGALQLPSGEKTYPAPDVPTVEDMTYTLTASRPGATKACEAEVQILPPKNPYCELTREPYVVYENLPQAQISWLSYRARTLTLNPGGKVLAGDTGAIPVGGPGEPPLKVGHNIFTLTAANGDASYNCTTDILMQEDPCGGALRDLGAAVVLEKEYRDIGDVITVGTAGGGKVAIGSVKWILKWFGKSSKAVSGGMVNYYCEQLAQCKVRNGHADSGKIEYYNQLGNVAATCEFKKNPDGTVTAKGELSGRLKSLGVQ